jgi:hypothetical protein
MATIINNTVTVNRQQKWTVRRQNLADTYEMPSDLKEAIGPLLNMMTTIDTIRLMAELSGYSISLMNSPGSV